MSETVKATVTVVGIDIGNNSFHVVGLDRRGAIVLRQRWSRGQVETRFANMPPCLLGPKRGSARAFSSISTGGATCDLGRGLAGAVTNHFASS
jgi:hypothetical protein